jgi:hypothetical protein
VTISALKRLENPGWKAAGIRLKSGLPHFYGLLTRGDYPEAERHGIAWTNRMKSHD